MTMRDDRAVIEHCERGRVDRLEFSRHRAFLVIGEPRGLERGRLALRSHEKEVEIGMFLTDERRSATARRHKKRATVG